jgi:HlyD family secretion protein
VSQEIDGMRQPLKRIGVVIVVLAVLVGVSSVILPERASRDWVEGSGVIEATEVDVAAQVGGQLLTVAVREGQSVAEGGLIAELDATALSSQLQQARGALDAAEGELARAEAGLAGAQASLRNTRQQYERSTELKGRFEQAEAQYQAALAAREQAQATLDLVRAGARDEQVEQARAALARAEAEWENARRELARREALLAEGAISDQQVDFQRTAEESARAAREQTQAALAEAVAGARTEEERQAEAAFAQAEANLTAAERARETARELYGDKLELKQRLEVAEAEAEAAAQAKRAAEGRMQSARGTLAMAEKRLNDATVASPLDAVVILRIREPGETVGAGQPIVRLADLDHMWMRLYVPETEIGRVKLGQQAEVVADGSPGRSFAGTVSEIAQKAEFTPKNVQTKEQRVKLVFGVKIEVENPDQELKPGMPADARLRVGGGGQDG